MEAMVSNAIVLASSRVLCSALAIALRVWQLCSKGATLVIYIEATGVSRAPLITCLRYDSRQPVARAEVSARRRVIVVRVSEWLIAFVCVCLSVERIGLIGRIGLTVEQRSPLAEPQQRSALTQCCL